MSEHNMIMIIRYVFSNTSKKQHSIQSIQISAGDDGDRPTSYKYYYLLYYTTTTNH